MEGGEESEGEKAEKEEVAKKAEEAKVANGGADSWEIWYGKPWNHFWSVVLARHQSLLQRVEPRLWSCVDVMERYQIWLSSPKFQL